MVRSRVHGVSGFSADHRTSSWVLGINGRGDISMVAHNRHRAMSMGLSTPWKASTHVCIEMAPKRTKYIILSGASRRVPDSVRC